MRRMGCLGVVVGVVSAVPVVLTLPAEAAEAEEGELEEVMVTAGRRVGALQRSDVSATVLTREAIDEARLRDVRRLDELVPNVQFNETGQLSSVFITIRGVESNPFIVNRAAVYIDGIPFRELNNAVLNQVESIEVLRGPQATLYGANSESGLVLVHSRAPSALPAGSLRVTGMDFPSGRGVEADGFLSGPVRDGVLAGSVAFKLGKEDAWLRNLASSIGEPGEVREAFLQGRLRWTPTERVTVDATSYALRLRAPGLFDQEFVPLDLDMYNANYADNLNGGRRIGRFTNLNDAPKRTTEDEFVAGANAAFELDYGQVDAALSFRREDSDSRGLDFDFTAMPAVAGAEYRVEEFWNAEVRFTSPEGERFDYIVGISAYDEFERNTKATFLGEGGLDSFVAAPAQRAYGRDYGVFASANWRPAAIPKTTVGFGLRYDHARRSTKQTAGTLDLGFGTVIAYPDADLGTTFETFLPRLSVRHEISDALSVYASAARGYIPGGFNLAAVQAGFTDPNILLYDKETLRSVEAGFHWRNPGRTLRASGAVFTISSNNWQEIQIATDASGRPVSSDFIGSSASIRSRGVELEGEWRPVRAFSLNAHLGYVDAQYRNLQADEATNLRGKAIQFVPEYDGLLAARYQWPAGFYVRGEVGFTGEFPLEARGRAVQPAVTTWGLQLGYESARYSVRLFGENLTNERRASGMGLTNLAFGTDGTFYAPVEAPRILGLELEVKF